MTTTPVFTKRHYEKLALFYTSIPFPTKKKRRAETMIHVANALTNMLEADNPRFDCKKFHARIKEIVMEKHKKDNENAV